MLLPDNRYQFSSKREQRRSGKKAVIIILAIVIAAGIGVFFILRNKKPQDGGINLTEKELMYQYWEARKYDSLIDYCNKQLESDSLDTSALIFGGFAYFYKGLSEYATEQRFNAIDNSIVFLRKARIIENHPHSAEIEYVLGKAYFHKGKYYLDESIRFLLDSVKDGYKAEDTYEYLGLAYAELENYKKSVEYFLKAVEENPSDLLLLTIAQTYYKTGDIKDAEEFLIRTINRTDDPALEEKSRFLLAQIYMDKEEYIKAEDQYNQILENNPQSADAHFHLGEIYSKMNDNIKARAEWRKTLQIDPSHYGARLHYYN